MRIPASDRQEVMKGIPLQTLLSELEKRRFTGYCATPIAGASALLVMEEGKYILAEYRGIRGKDALESIRSIGDPVVDVVIAPSSSDQVAEMVRMNGAYLVHPPRQPGLPAPDLRASSTVIRPISIGGSQGKPVKVIAVQTKTREEQAPQPQKAAGVGKAAGKPAAGQPGPAERLDRKGLDHLKTLKDSFKNDAADLLSELNLGHLAVNRPKTDKGNEGEGGEKSGTG
jgi:hypothetical protein